MDQRFRQVRRDAGNASLSLAHDFRNMLQLATSGLSLARRELLSKRDVRLASVLRGAIQALERANLLAQRLGGSGSSESAWEEVLLQRAVPGLRGLLRQAIGGTIAFDSLVADDLPPIRCNPLDLENALLNLALNARHAMPVGGTLMIEAERCTDHRNCATLSVTDTGHGMAADEASRAFEPFFSTRLPQGGTGLGLYNVRAFAEALGGSAQLSTKPDAGTRVVLHLPTKGPSRLR